MGVKTFNGLPLYEDTICDEACGMLRISLVDLPAVESDFQKFGKRARVVMESEEQRLILGVVMRADFPIYRVDDRGEYYTIFSRETIRQMAEKYLEENRQNRVNLMHCGEEVRGVQMVQLFIKDSARGITPAGFEDIEDGSLFAEFHIADEEIWGWVKEGVLRGFSLEGFFSLEEKFNKEYMAIDFKKWKLALAKILAKFAELNTDKGVLTWEGELAAGVDVYLLNEDGEVTDAADGEYTAEDGRTVVVADGKVTEVREVTEAAGEIAADVDIHNLAAEVERLKEKLEEKDKALAGLLSRVEALEAKGKEAEEALRKMSASLPAHEEVKGASSEKKQFRNAHEEFLYRLNGAR